MWPTMPDRKKNNQYKIPSPVVNSYLKSYSESQLNYSLAMLGLCYVSNCVSNKLLNTFQHPSYIYKEVNYNLIGIAC